MISLRLDFRSLALFRMAFSLVVIFDIFLRYRSFVDHYTEYGIAPLSLLNESIKKIPISTSLFFLSSEPLWSYLLFIILVLSAFSLLIGYQSRIASILVWLLILSLQARSPYLNYGADRFVSVLAFWSMWLPLSKRWSIDTKKQELKKIEIESGASFAYTFQIAIIYWMSAISKGHPVWRTDFSAVECALSLDSFSTAAGRWLLQFPRFLQWVTRATIILEELGPFLLFTPWFRSFSRLAVVCLFISFHIFGLATSLHLGIFPFVCATAWLPFIPGSFWNSISGIHLLINSVYKPPTWQSFTCYIFLSYVLLWNMRTIFQNMDARYFPENFGYLGESTGLQQHWNLYAPRPRSSDGWLIAEATLIDGRKIDLLNNFSAVSYDRPEDLWSRFHSARDRGYMQDLYFSPNARILSRFIYFLDKKASRNHILPIDSIKLYMMLENSNSGAVSIKRFRMWPYSEVDHRGSPVFKEDPLIAH